MVSRLLPLSALVMASAAVFAVTFHVDSVSSLREPFEFSQDALVMQSFARACSEQPISCLEGKMPRLGAPFEANWADFPKSDDWLFWAVGRLMRFGSLGFGINLAFLFAAVAAAVAFYLCAVARRVAQPLAFVLSLLFAFCPFYFTRNEQHFSLITFFVVPTSVWVLARLGRGSRSLLVLTLSGFLGLQLVYFTAYHLVGVVLVALMRRRRPGVVKTCGLSLVATLCGVVLGNADTVLLLKVDGPNPQAIRRPPSDATGFALWPEQLFIPSDAHRFESVRKSVEPYARRFGRRGEFASAYLGAAGIVGLLLLFVRAARRWRRPPFEAAYAATLVVLALPKIGVLALWAQLTGHALLRSNNRVSIVLLSLALLHLGRILSLRQRRMRSGAQALLLVALCACLYEQIPLSDFDTNPTFRVDRQRQLESLRAFTGALEQRGVSNVFVYPHGDFPEDSESPFGDGYLPLQLYLTSSTLRFSYGAVRGRPSSEWSRQTASLANEALKAELNARKFDALVTHQSACDAACMARLTEWFGAPLPANPGSGWVAWSLQKE
jgi:hypothetical protein